MDDFDPELALSFKDRSMLRNLNSLLLGLDRLRATVFVWSRIVQASCRERKGKINSAANIFQCYHRTLNFEASLSFLKRDFMCRSCHQRRGWRSIDGKHPCSAKLSPRFSACLVLANSFKCPITVRGGLYHTAQVTFGLCTLPGFFDTSTKCFSLRSDIIFVTVPTSD